MNKMEKDYDNILNLDFDRKNLIPLTTAADFIFTDNRKRESLNGEWGFTPDVFQTVTRKQLFSLSDRDNKGRYVPMDLDFTRMELVPVPGCWNCIRDQYWYYEGESVYARTFIYEKEKEDERVFLRIGAANYECRIWVNGKLLARHQGGFTPFYAELTDELVQENHLVITVNNRRELEQIPSMNYDWFNYGGITRSVDLFRLPPVFIKDFFCYLMPNTNFEKIEMKIKLSSEAAGQICRFSIAELGINEQVSTDERGEAVLRVSAHPELWSPQNPRLYTVALSCGEDRIEDLIGFREIRIQGKQILLNGQEIFLKGVCCHEESRDGGRTLSDDERMDIINTAKEMGCNALRLAHYPHSERMSQLADRHGLLLWEEIPVYWAVDFSNEETLLNAQNQMRELIMRDKNRASVIIWGVGNENPDTQERLNFMKQLIDICKEYDQTRPVSAACLVDVDTMSVKDRLTEFVDLVAFNEYYGWYYRDYEGIDEILNNTAVDKPLAITETGAGAKTGHHGGAEELFTEEHQEKVYRKQLEYIDGRLQGFFPWILFDFVSPVRKHPMQGGKNSKGLVDLDKDRKKKAFYVMQEYYREKLHK